MNEKINDSQFDEEIISSTSKSLSGINDDDFCNWEVWEILNKTWGWGGNIKFYDSHFWKILNKS